MQRAEQSGSSHEIDIIKAQSFADIFTYTYWINIEMGNYIFKLAELYDKLQGLLAERGVDIRCSCFS